MYARSGKLHHFSIPWKGITRSSRPISTSAPPYFSTLDIRLSEHRTEIRATPPVFVLQLLVFKTIMTQQNQLAQNGETRSNNGAA